VTHQLFIKPLKDLYSTGINAPTVDPADSKYLLLFLEIERTIVRFNRNHPGLTYGTVTSALNKLGISPEADFPQDELAMSIQWNLRMMLNTCDYSRYDVIQAIRKINKSVARHTRADGPRGYLDFIRKYIPL
jgi:hypothetical protein